MFGYLNLNDPTKIGATESQEIRNCRIDKGYLSYQQWDIDQSVNRSGKDAEGRRIFIGGITDPTTDKFPQPYQILRQLDSARFGRVGTPHPTLASLIPCNPAPSGNPDITTDTGDSPVYYAITLYDPETSEEGAPVFFTHNTDGTTPFTIRDFPGISYYYPEKTQAEWRIYRRPIGSAEYLRIPFAVIQAYSDNATVYTDSFADSDLSEALGTVGHFRPVDYSSNCQVFTVHNNRLWFAKLGTAGVEVGLIPIAKGYALYFSKPYIYGEVHVLNYFLFPSEIVGLFSTDEALVVLTRESAFTVYGDTNADFVVKEMTSSNIGSAGFYAAQSIEKNIFFLGSDKTDRTKAGSVFAIVGSSIKKLSANIESIFPVYSTQTISATIKSYGAGSQEDRFFITRYGTDSSGNVALSDFKYLIYDVLGQGFLQGDKSTTFTYRSKEFGTPGWWTNARRMFVRGLGEFTVELYSDGELIDSIDFNITGSVPQTEDYTVPPLRGNYFSYRFIGQPNAKIYEFGKKE